MKIRQIRVDGYKNLINCKVDLGDFNVLVGPNNSGKSNLLEAMQIIWPICFGDEKLRKAVLGGVTPRFTADSSLCHLEKYKNKRMTVGIVLEAPIDGTTWIVDYEVMIQCGESENNDRGFVSEKLTAKIPGTPGRAAAYIAREGTELRVQDKTHTISTQNSSFLAVSVLYPDSKGLPPELAAFIETIRVAIAVPIFALSPSQLREDIDTDKAMDHIRVSSFGLLSALDAIQQEGKYFSQLEESICDILDLEHIIFRVEVKTPPGSIKDAKGAAKRIRYLLLKRPGDSYSLVEEYSDGTLVVMAVLEALFAGADTRPLLCLEELENCLHPAAVEKLLRLLRDHADQWPVLITTHSPYVLNGVSPEDVHVAVVDETGATHFEKVKNSKQLRDYLNRNLMSFGDLLIKHFEGFREE